MKLNEVIRIPIIVLYILVMVIAGCTSAPAEKTGTQTVSENQSLLSEANMASTMDPAIILDPHLMETRQKIVEGGLSLVGKTKLVVHGKTYSNDCTGVVLASYAFGNIDLSLHFPKHSGNGVRRIFYTLNDENLLYKVEYPVAGDVIFWDNTYDANGNGLVDDEFTHVGLVVDVAADGLISYLHHHYRLGPIVEYMNLLLPDREYDDTGRRINSALRMRGLSGDIGTNAAQVFKIFGQGWRLPQTIEQMPVIPE